MGARVRLKGEGIFMSPVKKMLNTLLLFLVWIFSLAWGIIWFRFLAVPLFIVFTFLLPTLPFHKQKGIVIAFGLVFLTLTVSPIDIGRAQHPITRRVVTNLVGLPTHESWAKARRGELYLHGCIGFGTEPKWIIVCGFPSRWSVSGPPAQNRSVNTRNHY